MSAAFSTRATRWLRSRGASSPPARSPSHPAAPLPHPRPALARRSPRRRGPGQRSRAPPRTNRSPSAVATHFSTSGSRMVCTSARPSRIGCCVSRAIEAFDQLTWPAPVIAITPSSMLSSSAVSSRRLLSSEWKVVSSRLAVASRARATAETHRDLFPRSVPRGLLPRSAGEDHDTRHPLRHPLRHDGRQHRREQQGTSEANRISRRSMCSLPVISVNG